MKASAPALLAVRNSTENEPHGAFVTRVPENTGTLLSVMPTRNGWPPRLLSTSISSRIRPSSPLAFNAQVLPGGAVAGGANVPAATLGKRRCGAGDEGGPE